MNCASPSAEVLEAMAYVEVNLGIRLWTCPVFTDHDHGRKYAHHRLFFTVPTGGRDDCFAARFGESICLTCEVILGPLYEMTPAYFAFPVRLSLLNSKKGVHLKTLVKWIDRDLEHSNRIHVANILSGFSGISDDIVAIALRSTIVLHSDQWIRMAAAFMSKSSHDFHVYPGQLDEALHEGDWQPPSAYELAQWESAFHNAYKAVEAIVGDPSKNETRFLTTLTRMGIDPTELVGYAVKEPISTVIRKMNELRDKRVAHGSTPARGIRMNQMVEFIECARYVVQSRLNNLCEGVLFR